MLEQSHDVTALPVAAEVGDGSPLLIYSREAPAASDAAPVVPFLDYVRP
jgi:hypothetical protein